MHAYDAYMCYNAADKGPVTEIALTLRECGIVPWLDEWELRPGIPWQEALENEIERIKSAVVFVGNKGIGPWQNRELRAFLEEFIRRGCPVIPVVLPSARARPKLPVFLRSFTWVDFRRSPAEALDRLIWGITGQRPRRGMPLRT